MVSAPLPPNEADRQHTLDKLELLDTPAEQEFDDITKIASYICGTPIALISLVDKDRQWFKSRVGLDIPETPRSIAFCAHAILGDDIFEVPDASLDDRFKDNPVVTGEVGLRFYAGVPLVTSDQHNMGTLCVIDREPRKLSDSQRDALKALGRQIMRLVELRQMTRSQSELRRQLAAETALSRAIIENAGAAIISTDLDATILTFNPAAEQMLGYEANEVIGKVSPVSFHDPQEVAKRGAELSARFGEEITGLDIFLRPLKDAANDTTEWTYARKDGKRIPIIMTLSLLRDDSGRAFGYLGIIRDLSEVKAKAKRFEAAAQLSEIVRRSQESFIASGPSKEMFDHFLADILAFTSSEYGFIGEVLHDETGAPYLKTHAITNIAWDDATRKLYEEHKEKGFIFQNMKTLFGAAMTTAEPVIANHPESDPRRGGLPPGHPHMGAFLGLPIKYGGKLVGLVGLANRPGGYDEEFVRELSPLASSCAALIHAMRLDIQRVTTQQSLLQEKDRFRLIIETAAEAFIEITQDGKVTEWNQRAAEEFHVPVQSAEGMPIDELFTLRREDGQTFSLLDHLPRELEKPGQPSEFTFQRGSDHSDFQGELVMWAMPQGDERRYCAFIRDVTERHELQKQQRLRFESETLLKEIHHRVKNNMQVISSLLSIQSGKLKDAAQRDVFLECRERIRAMSLIHDRLYSTGRYEGIDFGDYLREMVSLITSSNRPSETDVMLDIKVNPIEVPVEKAVPLSLIASELVLNSLKHAFKGRSEGILTVRLDEKDGACHLFIGDDGPGFSVSNQSSSGIGVQLIQMLTKQIKGRVEFTGAPDSGTTIIWKQ